MTNQHRHKLSPSVAKGLPLSRRLSEGLKLFRQYPVKAEAERRSVFENVAEYDALLRQHAGVRLREARVFEIGFGARPHRQMLLHSMGVDASGVDAEVPVLSGRPAEFLRMLKQNGPERAAKSLLRHAFFDRADREALTVAMRQHGLEPRLDESKLTIGDAGKVHVAPLSLDLVFSEDVFEHIERTTLERLVSRMATWLRPRGLALIRPNVFTGIIGGHLWEWSRESMQGPPTKRESEPWEHLRKRRFAPNTYLNELTRADYRKLFSVNFEILEERVAQPMLGGEYLDDDAQRDLTGWPDDELFSNQTLFVLRPRANVHAGPENP